MSHPPPKISDHLFFNLRDDLLFSDDAGEWQDNDVIAFLIRKWLGCSRDTARQYAGRWLRRAHANRDIERSLTHRSWRALNTQSKD